MTKRILLYAALYGGIGAVVGVLMALYTKDTSAPVTFTVRAPEAPRTESMEGKPDE